MIVAILVALGMGGRWTAALLFILVLGIVHRIHFLTGPVDYLLTAMLGYLVIHSGKEEKLLSVGIEGTNTSILETLAQRLLQVHYYGWLLLCFFSHQAGLIWWQGEASWWLAASGRNSFFGTEELYLQSWLVNGLTHATIGVLLVAILAIPFAKTRPLGWIATLIYWCGGGVLVVRSDLCSGGNRRQFLLLYFAPPGNGIPNSRIRSCISCQTSFLTSGLRSK